MSSEADRAPDGRAPTAKRRRQGGVSTPVRRPRDRPGSEARLITAAIRILEHDGVLAGLNLSKVADEAGVNRALVHQYFGSKRAFLRAALADQKRATEETMFRHMDRPAADWTRWAFEQMLRFPEFAKMHALLALDGDDEFEVFPGLEKVTAALEKRVADGELDPSADGFALTALWNSMLFGYTIFREAMARNLDIPLDELDERVMAVADDMVRAVAEDLPTLELEKSQRDG